MDAIEKINRIKAWNNSFLTHELTCGEDTCKHVVMDPVLSSEVKDAVVLVCPKCKRIQNYIPSVCYNMSVEDIKKAEDKLIEQFPQLAKNRR